MINAIKKVHIYTIMYYQINCYYNCLLNCTYRSHQKIIMFIFTNDECCFHDHVWMMEYETRLQEKISHNNHYYLCNKNNYYIMYYYVLYYLSLLHMLELVLSGGILEKWWWYHYFFYSHLILCIICNGIKSEIRIEFIFYVWPKELAELEKVNNYFSNIGIFIFGEKRIKK